MRTDMFGLSMLAEPLAPDYEGTVGAVIRSTFGNPDAARSDPAKVASAILRIADEKNPPVRLLVGSARAEEDGRWRTLSESTDRDG